jgi:uncharacterized membrane protein YphA (DoxX/SURF4 family)
MMRNVHKFTGYLIASPWPYRLLRVGIAILFLWAGAIKLWHPKIFARAIADYGILPDIFIVPVAIGLPLLEVLAGISLLLDIALGLRLTFGLLLLFLSVLAYAIFRGLDIDCGCFSADEIRSQNNVKFTFLRDLVLTGAVLFLLYCRRGRTRAEKIQSNI